MKLRSGRIIGSIKNQVVEKNTPIKVFSNSVARQRKCSHYSCTLWNNDVCCICDDKRPIQKYGYIAYTNPELDDYTFVTRQHYYCKGCQNYIRFSRHMSKKISHDAF